MTEDNQYAPEQLTSRLNRVRNEIDAALERAGRGDDVKMVAVSKTHPVEAIRTLYEAGVRRFGASYVQEWEQKAPALPDDIEWHFVGRLQSNKAKYIADRISMVHSVDRKSVTKALHRRSEEPVDVLLQVNLGMQETKGGVGNDDVEELLEMTTNYPRIRVRGLMGMPPYSDDPEASRPHFRTLRRTLERLQDYAADHHPERRAALTELSMGMTNDFSVAIEEGATIIRLGTALFGKREYDD